MIYGNLSTAQLGAIRKSLELAIQLQKDIPEIPDDCRRGFYPYEIASKYNVRLRYNVTEEIASQSVYYSLVGHRGGFKVQAFLGSLLKGERRKLGLEHRSRNSYENGKKLYENKKGIHGRSPEKMSEDGRNAVKKHWDNYRRKKYGIH